MAITPPQAGELRARVRFERKAAVNDGYGNAEGDWLPLIPSRAARLTPARGGEQVIGQRLQGVSAWDLWVRYDRETAAVTTDDRVVDARDASGNRSFAIRFAQDMDGRRRWILMQLELGAAT
jgi:head-tail adaptor